MCRLIVMPTMVTESPSLTMCTGVMVMTATITAWAVRMATPAYRACRVVLRWAGRSDGRYRGRGGEDGHHRVPGLQVGPDLGEDQREPLPQPGAVLARGALAAGGDPLLLLQEHQRVRAEQEEHHRAGHRHAQRGDEERGRVHG